MEQGGAVYVIDNEVQQRVIDIRQVVEAMEDSYRAWDAGFAVIRPKTNLYVYNDVETRYGFSTMEGAVHGTGIVAIRIKSDFHHNRYDRLEVPAGQSVPTSAQKGAGAEGKFCGLVYLFDAHSGLPLAILNDGYLQHVRVAASAAVAAKYLAREDACTLGILGSQWMARTHAPAICGVRPITRVKVYSPTREHREAFAREMSQRLDVEVQARESPEEVVRGSDIVACCTNSHRRPVLSGEWLERGTFLSNVLSSELDDAALARIDYTVKNQPVRDLSRHIFEAGIPPADLERPNEGRGWLKQVNDQTPLLSEVVVGKARRRANESEVTFFSNNEGTGIQFATVGGVIISRLRELGDASVKKIPVDWFLQDIPD